LEQYWQRVFEVQVLDPSVRCCCCCCCCSRCCLIAVRCIKEDGGVLPAAGKLVFSPHLFDQRDVCFLNLKWKATGSLSAPAPPWDWANAQHATAAACRGTTPGVLLVLSPIFSTHAARRG
ncbi:unnamed protein product, partial [Laminaria digitata]